MPHFRTPALLGFALSAYLMALPSAAVRADFIINSNNRISRVTDEGQVVRTFNVSQFFDDEGNGSLPTLGGVGPDGTLYVIAEDTAVTSAVIRYDVRTGEPLDALAAPFTGSNKIPGFLSLHDLDFGPNGDLFLLGFQAGDDVIHRIDPHTGESKSSFSSQAIFGDDPLPSLDNIAVRPAPAGTPPYDADVYASYGFGVLANYRSSNIAESTPGAPPANTDWQGAGQYSALLGQLRAGPDGKLYSRSFGSAVYQYDVDAQTNPVPLVPPIPDPCDYTFFSGGAFLFGPDDDLFVMSSGSVTVGPLGGITHHEFRSAIYRFDGQTGAAEGPAFPLLPASAGYLFEIVYLPVREPTAALGIVSALVGLVSFGRRSPGFRRDANRVGR